MKKDILRRRENLMNIWRNFAIRSSGMVGDVRGSYLILFVFLLLRYVPKTSTDMRCTTVAIMLKPFECHIYNR